MFTRGYKVPIDQLDIHHIKEWKSIVVHAETLPGMVARCIANVFRKPLILMGKLVGFQPISPDSAANTFLGSAIARAQGQTTA